MVLFWKKVGRCFYTNASPPLADQDVDGTLIDAKGSSDAMNFVGRFFRGQETPPVFAACGGKVVFDLLLAGVKNE